MAVLQIFLQYCYSTILNIELYCSQYCKKKKLYFTPPISPEISLSSLLFFPVLFSLFLLCSPSTLSSLKLHRRNFSPIFEISHPSHTAFLSSLITQPLSHCTGARFGFLRLEVGLAWIGELGLDRWAGIG